MAGDHRLFTEHRHAFGSSDAPKRLAMGKTLLGKLGAF
jgi:hypothetical protein